MPMEIQPTLYVPDRAGWRAWLAEHHASAAAIWLITYKPESGTPSVAYLHAVEEALCFEALLAADALAWGRCEDFLIIEEAGKPLGGASGFVMDEGDYRPFRLDRLVAVAALLGWDGAAHATFRERYEAVWSAPRDPSLAPSAEWTIECVAVRPEARGRGVAKQLVRAVIARGQALSHPAVGIAVTLGNEPAQRVYEAVGFQPYVTYWAAYFHDAFPGTQKYRLALG